MGEVFAGRYELVDPIGTGGMGSVWRTFDHREGTFCAAKVLRQSDAATVLRFIREQSLRIRHPHIVAPRNWAGEDDRVLFTMDLVRGGAASTVLEDHGPLPSGYVAVLLEQLLAALDAVHQAGVVHRDVKPSNLLLEPTGVGRPFARLTDFGIAVQRSEPRLTSTGLVLGTPGYLAPEAFTGTDPEPRQDLYSAGLAAIELLTGAQPPSAPTERDQDVAEAPPAGVDPGLWQLLRRLCAVDPEVRPPDALRAREELLRLPDARQPSDPLVAPVDAPGAWYAGPDPVEVFDQVGPLPRAWADRAASGPPSRPPPTRPEPAAPSSRQDAPGPHPAAGQTAAAPAGTGPLPSPTSSAPRRRWWPLPLATVAVGAAVGLGSTQLPWPQAESATDQGERSGNGLQPGDRCSFVEAGASTDGVDGALRCVKTNDGDYRWRTR